MLSTILFSLSALCVAAMFIPRKPSQVVRADYTYYVCDSEQMPTWQRKTAPTHRVAIRQG